MRTLDQMMLFAAVAENLSFTAAAKQLGLSKAHVSRQISLLEEELGVPLLYRTTRMLKLTEEGQLVWEQCLKLSQVLGETRSGLVELQGKVQGHLRVTAPLAFGEAFLLEIVNSFIQKYPDVKVDIELANRPQDLLRKEFDLAIRITSTPPESMIARPLTILRYIFCASASYLEEHGKPQSIEELTSHNCLSHIYHKNRWVFFEGQEMKTVQIKGSMRFNLNSMLKQAIVQGHGIGRIPQYVVAPELRTGQVVQLFSHCQPETIPIYLLYPPRNSRPLKIKYFVEHLKEWFEHINNDSMNF